MVTLTSIMTDNDFSILDINGEPIKRLYTAGNCLGNRYTIVYATPVVKKSIGMAMTHGMLQ